MFDTLETTLSELMEGEEEKDSIRVYDEEQVPDLLRRIQVLEQQKNTKCLWKIYRYKESNRQEKTIYSTLEVANSACICADLNGIYQGNAIFPTEISTMYYEDVLAKSLQ